MKHPPPSVPPPALRPSTWPAALICAAFLLGPTAEAQALWKWRDASGRVVVSDTPPPREVPARDILQQPPGAAPRKPDNSATSPASQANAAGSATAAVPVASASAPGAATPAPPRVDPELEKRRKAAEQAQAAQAKADEARQADQRRENCSRARGHLAGLESGQRMARMNEKGEREILDDKARAEEIRRAREVIAADCR